MNDIERISLSVVGEDTQQVYNCDFKIKVLLTREDKFAADQKRREMLGPNPADALPMLQLDAFMLGLLSVRIVDPPEWWKNLEYGRKLKDGNVIAAIYNAANAKEDERKLELKKKSAAALEQIASQQVQQQEAEADPQAPEPKPKASNKLKPL